MKNIYLIPTDKPSRVYLIKSNNRLGLTSTNPEYMENFGSGTQNQNIYITSDEEITEMDWFYDLDTKYIKIKQSLNNSHLGFNGKKIILTTDQDLIKDGVQVIDDEFLQWYVKNPSCDEVKVEITEISCIIPNFGDVDKYRIVIPKEEPKQITSLDGDGLGGIPKGVLTMLIGKKEETLEEAAVFKSHHSEEDFIRGGRWQQEQDKNRHSDEEVLELLVKMNEWPTTFNGEEEVKEWFEKFKKK